MELIQFSWWSCFISADGVVHLPGAKEVVPRASEEADGPAEEAEESKESRGGDFYQAGCIHDDALGGSWEKRDKMSLGWLLQCHMNFFGIYDDVDGTAEEAEESKESCWWGDDFHDVDVDQDDDYIQRS